jgi:hypothetical protein
MERMGRPKSKSRPDESNYDYQKRAQKQKYKDNPEYTAKCKIKYYKKLYKENEDFKKILETHKNVLELLPDIIRFHGLYKIDKINSKLLELN